MRVPIYLNKTILIINISSDKIVFENNMSQDFLTNNLCVTTYKHEIIKNKYSVLTYTILLYFEEINI